MQVKIDWMDGFCNDPTFQVSDVTMPDWPAALRERLSKGA